VKAIRYRRGRPGVVCADIPQPSAGLHEVLLRVDAAGLCGTDVTIAYGAGGRMVSQDALTLGHETAGTIAGLGPGVDGWQAGDRVAVSPIVTCGHCKYCDLGASENCNHAVVLGLGRDGSLAEFLAVPASTLVRLPDNVPATTGAIITDAVATPYHALLERARLTPGESIAVFGVGGLGQHAIQIARLAGAAPVIAVDPRPEQLELRSRTVPTLSSKGDRLMSPRPCGGPTAAAGSTSPRTSRARRPAPRRPSRRSPSSGARSSWPGNRGRHPAALGHLRHAPGLANGSGRIQPDHDRAHRRPGGRRPARPELVSVAHNLARSRRRGTAYAAGQVRASAQGSRPAMTG